MRPAANPIQRAVQEIDIDIARKDREIGKLRAAREALAKIIADLGLNHRSRVRIRTVKPLRLKAAKVKKG